MRFSVFRALTPDEAVEGRDAPSFDSLWSSVYGDRKARMWVEFLAVEEKPTLEELQQLVNPSWRIGARFMVVDNDTREADIVDLHVEHVASLIPARLT